MKTIILAIGLAVVAASSLFVATTAAAPPKTYEDATKKYERTLAEAKREFDAGISIQKTSIQDATDRYQQTVSDAMIEFAVDVSKVARAVGDSGDHEKSIELLDKSTALISAASEFERKVVALRLSRQDAPATQPVDQRQVDLFKSDPASSYQEFCKNFMRSMQKNPTAVSQEYEVDLKKTDSLITPYVGTFIVGDARHADHEWRLTIVAQGGRWLIKRVEEHSKDSDEKGWQDTPDFKRVTLFVKALQSVQNP